MPHRVMRGGSGVDPKLLERPQVFDGTASRWPEWKFKFKAWASTTDPEAMLAMDEAERYEEPIDIARVPPRLRLLGGFIYAALISYSSGVPMQIVHDATSANGFEAWRSLAHFYEPRLASRRLVVLTTLLEPDLGTESQCLERFLKWERELRQEAAIVGQILGDELKIAVVLKRVPEELRRYLQLRSAEIAGSYESFACIWSAIFRRGACGRQVRLFRWKSTS